MRAQLVVVLGVEALDGCVLDRPVHPLDLAVRPRVVRLGQPVLDPIGFADHVEAHRPRIDGVPVPGLLGELDAVVGQYGVDLTGNGFEQMLEEFPGSLSISRFNKLSDRKLGSSVDADEEKKLSFSGLHLGNVEVEEADGVALEFLPLGLVALDIRQT